MAVLSLVFVRKGVFSAPDRVPRIVVRGPHWQTSQGVELFGGSARCGDIGCGPAVP